MNERTSGGIQPHHEAFYLEALLSCTTGAIDAAEQVREALNRGIELEAGSAEWQDCAREIVDGVQALVTHAAALSRYFWPARKQAPHVARATQLRHGLEVREDSPLRDRDLRNHLEHFDERLDLFCQDMAAGLVLPTYVGPKPFTPEVPTYHFRAYYTDVGVLDVLGQQFEVQPLLDEVRFIHERLLECVRDGGRIRPPDDAA